MFILVCMILIMAGLFLLLKTDKWLKIIGGCLLLLAFIGLMMLLSGFIELPL